MNNNNGLRTWIEVDKRAIKHNYKIFRSLIDKKCQLMAVVKSNAYGHSLLDFSKEMEKLGADWLGVDSIVEAESLRQAGIKTKILILGHTLPEKIPSAIKNNISLTVSNFQSLNSLAKIKIKKPAKIHLKIDTGMHRQGFFVPELKKAAQILKKNKNIKVEGMYTHFSSAKNPAFPQETLKQIFQFKQAIKIFKTAGFNPIKHAAATSGAINFPQAHFDLVRIGIGLYGMWPSKETREAFRDKIKLKPVLLWKTVISEIKNLSKDSRIGYDLTETVNKNSRIAILPIGYWHGYPRALSSIGRILIKGKEAKILGRISMDMAVADITDIKNAKIGDEAILIGEKITADNLAYLADTINYEITTRINPLIKRIYI
ncbi:alanine racemase [Patescibacteria group bacterium]|nr:alanine racemase [Patescibacteria group bacterium]